MKTMFKRLLLPALLAAAVLTGAACEPAVVGPSQNCVKGRTPECIVTYP